MVRNINKVFEVPNIKFKSFFYRLINNLVPIILLILNIYDILVSM